VYLRSAGRPQGQPPQKGRPTGRVGSITVPSAAIFDIWDLTRLPEGLSPRQLAELVDTFFAIAPSGSGGLRLTTFPGLRMPVERLPAPLAGSAGTDLLYITSANRSRHLTGTGDSPAHWRADGLRTEFGDEPGFVILEHPDEAAARARYPQHLPMSTTIEPYGSLSVDAVRTVLAGLGFGLALGPGARTRLGLRDYPHSLSKR
jgi:hypothetical protein